MSEAPANGCDRVGDVIRRRGESGCFIADSSAFVLLSGAGRPRGNIGVVDMVEDVPKTFFARSTERNEGKDVNINENHIIKNKKKAT